MARPTGRRAPSEDVLTNGAIGFGMAHFLPRGLRASASGEFAPAARRRRLPEPVEQEEAVRAGGDFPAPIGLPQPACSGFECLKKLDGLVYRLLYTPQRPKEARWGYLTVALVL